MFLCTAKQRQRQIFAKEGIEKDGGENVNGFRVCKVLLMDMKREKEREGGIRVYEGAAEEQWSTWAFHVVSYSFCVTIYHANTT